MATPTAKLDLQTICDVLGSIEHKWFKIGVQLGIPRGKLLEFKKEEDPLSAVIDYWLRGNAQSSISWEFIAKILRSKYLGEPGLAEEISKDFCQKESTCDARKDHDAEGTLNTVPINPAIEENNQLKEHKDTADSLPTTTSSEASLPQDSKISSQESKNPPKIPSQDSKNPQQDETLDPKVKEDLKFILQRNLKEIMVKYASYVDCLRMAIKDKVSTEDLQSYLLSLPVIKNMPALSELSLLSDKERELKKCNTVTEIFNLLTTKCASFLNYDVFHCILTHYGVSDDQEKLKYPEHLKAYTEKHKISEFAKINPLVKSKSGHMKLIVKYDIETTCNLAKVIDLKHFIAEIMDLHPSALEIVDIEDGCVIVTFLIPTSVANVVEGNLPLYRQRFTDLKTKDQRAALIFWVKCNSELITSWNAEAKRPRGIAVNRKGEVIVTECTGHCVTMFSPSGVWIRSFGSRGSGKGHFEYPYGIAVDSKDNILVADCGNHRIQKFTVKGMFLEEVGTQGSGPLQFDLPRAITVSASNGRVYVANENGDIKILNSNLSYYGAFEPGHVTQANQLAYDSKGNVYVAEEMGIISVFTAEGNYLQNFETKGDSVYLSSTVAITHNDRVVVAHDTRIGNFHARSELRDYNILSIFSPSGQLQETIIGIEPMHECICGLAVDSKENIFICDYLGNKIICFSLAEVI